MNKKRYAGLLYTNPTKYDKIDSKGIEVRLLSAQLGGGVRDQEYALLRLYGDISWRN